MAFRPLGMDEGTADLPQEVRERIIETLVSAPGTAQNPHTDPDAVRNALLPKNFYQTPTEPTTWVDGDEWIMTP